MNRSIRFRRVSAALLTFVLLLATPALAAQSGEAQPETQSAEAQPDTPAEEK